MKILNGQIDLILNLYFRLQKDFFSLQDINMFKRFRFNLKKTKGQNLFKSRLLS